MSQRVPPLTEGTGGTPPADAAAAPPMTEPTAAAVTPSERWLRPSTRMLLVHPIIELLRALPALVALLFAGTSTGHGGLWSLAGASAVLLIAVVRLLTTRYRITPDKLQLRKGLLRRRTMDVPLDRIRTVDVTAHALHRVLGLAKVVIGTGTSDRRGRGGLEVDGLPTAVAASLRSELLHRGPPPGAAAHGAADIELEIVRLDPAWIRYAPFTLTGAITAVALAGFAWRLDQEARINLGKVGAFKDAASRLRTSPIWLDAIQISVVVVVVIAIASTVGYLLSFWNFRLTRHSGGSLHISRGLLTSRRTSIERTRLRGVEVCEPLLLRAVGGARCLAIATGLRVGRGAERGGTILLPPAPREQAWRVASEVLDLAGPFAARLVAHGARARRRRYLRALAGAAVVSGAIALICWLSGGEGWGLLAAPPMLGAAALLAMDRYRSLGHGLGGGYVVTRHGSIVRRSSSLSCEAIIGWNMRATLFQRRSGLTTLTATTAAGRQHYPFPDIAVGPALRFSEAAVPGLLAQFLAAPS